MMCPMKAFFLIPALLCAGLLVSCADKKDHGGAVTPAVKPTAWTNFSGDRALADVKALVDMGPRPSGSPEIETSRQFIEKRLHEAGWETRRQEFTADTIQRGPLKMANVIARFPVAGTDTWKRTVTTAVCSHYDTKWFSGSRFVGANDGGSSTGLLLEVARASAPVKDFAARLELVFFDGEEAITQFSDAGGLDDTRYDGLFGSRHYAKQLRTVPPSGRPKYGVVFDMIGDQRLEVEFPANGSERLSKLALKAADELGFGIHFSGGDPMVDDHVPLTWVGMEVIDFIDFRSYQPYWHTSADTFDKLNPESIQIAGRTGLLFLEKHLAD